MPPNSNDGGIYLNQNQYNQQSNQINFIKKPTEGPPGGYTYN